VAALDGFADALGRGELGAGADTEGDGDTEGERVGVGVGVGDEDDGVGVGVGDPVGLCDGDGDVPCGVVLGAGRERCAPVALPIVVPTLCRPQISASSGFPAATSTAVRPPSVRANTPAAAPA
jgi:hypothetical protein